MEKKYTKEGLTVIWKSDLCIHSGNCVKGLPSVFKPRDKPWIDLDGGEEDRIREVVARCPSGALSLGTEPVKKTDSAVKITYIRNGPIMVEGEVDMDYLGESPVSKKPRIALCRCGASGNKPYCDGTHKNTGFSD